MTSKSTLADPTSTRGSSGILSSKGPTLENLNGHSNRQKRVCERLKLQLKQSRERLHSEQSASSLLRKELRLRIKGINADKEEARQLFHRLITSQDNQRKRMSQDLNEEVAQTLAAIHVQLAALKSASAADSESFRNRISRIHTLIGHSAQVINRYARELQPAMLADIGLVPALRAHLRDISKRGRISVSLNANAGVEILSKKRRTVVYRIIQETLARLIELSGRRIVSIILVRNLTVIQLSISVKPYHRTNRDSVSMRTALLMANERLEMIGGRSVAPDAMAAETIFQAEIPLRAPSSR